MRRASSCRPSSVYVFARLLCTTRMLCSDTPRRRFIANSASITTTRPRLAADKPFPSCVIALFRATFVSRPRLSSTPTERVPHDAMALCSHRLHLYRSHLSINTLPQIVSSASASKSSPFRQTRHVPYRPSGSDAVSISRSASTPRGLHLCAHARPRGAGRRVCPFHAVGASTATATASAYFLFARCTARRPCFLYFSTELVVAALFPVLHWHSGPQ